ncbi:transcriptional regulator [Lecanora helva]
MTKILGKTSLEEIKAAVSTKERRRQRSSKTKSLQQFLSEDDPSETRNDTCNHSKVGESGIDTVLETKDASQNTICVVGVESPESRGARQDKPLVEALKSLSWTAKENLTSELDAAKDPGAFTGLAVKLPPQEQHPSSSDKKESAYLSRIQPPSQNDDLVEYESPNDKAEGLQTAPETGFTQYTGLMRHKTSDDDTGTAPRDVCGASKHIKGDVPELSLTTDITRTVQTSTSSTQSCSPGMLSRNLQDDVNNGFDQMTTVPESADFIPALNFVHADTQIHADENPLENIRPAPQNLRYGPYQNQQTPQNRTTPLGSGRLQNTSKPGSGQGWGFGAPNGVTALPSTTQLRQSGPGSTSFAQTIGGQQPAAPLDLSHSTLQKTLRFLKRAALIDLMAVGSEFPSLSGTSQPQYQNSSQAIWANQRAVQQTPVQRPQHQQAQQQQHQHQQQQQQQPIVSQAPQQHQNQQSHDQSHRSNEDMYSASSHLQNALEDRRYGGAGALGQMPATNQTQATNVDDFPPLGRNGTGENDDRRGVMQNAGFGSFANANTFPIGPDHGQSRSALPSASGSQANNTRSSSVADRLTSPNGVGFGASSSGRSPIDSNLQGNHEIQDHDRNQQANQLQQQDYENRTGDRTESAASPDRSDRFQMSAMEEFGLAGFAARARSENPDISGLARGPFADIGSRTLQPDFKLPECYVVDNVHRVRDKIPGFAEETLFWIFYNQPRDILQELAASEL